MRILHVIDSLGRAGAEQALVNVLPALHRLGHEVEVVALWPPVPLAAALEARDVPVTLLSLSHRWNLTEGVPRLARVVSQGRFDVVHAHSFFSAMYVALTRPLARAPKRFVTFHNLGYDSFPADTTWRRVRKRIDARLMRGAMDVRLAVSQRTARHYEQHLALPPIEVQYNGIDLAALQVTSARARAEVLARFGIRRDVPVVLVCGRLVHEKGHRYLFEALASMPRRPHVLVVGDGPLRDELVRDVAARGLGRDITIHPAIAHAELAEVMHHVDLLVMSSTHEGFPLTPAEAMAVGRAVVATRVGGLPELIEDGISGVLVPPREPELLAAAIARVLKDDDLRRRIERAGRERIVARFGSEAVAAELSARYVRAVSVK